MGDAFSRRLAVVLLASLSFLAIPGLASQPPLRVELQLEPPHLDPTLTAASTVAEALHLNVFQGLTRIDRHGEVQPALATRWEVSEDGLVYRFALRSDVRFHHGKTFDSAVAAYSLRCLLEVENANPQRHLFQAIRHVEEVGTHELRIELAQPDALLPFRLALSAAVIVHPDTVHTNRSHPVGTGPYRFVDWGAMRAFGCVPSKRIGASRLPSARRCSPSPPTGLSWRICSRRGPSISTPMPAA